jgi:non-heme chloroperoxidase
MTQAMTITEHEAKEVERANATGRQPVVFVHGLWLLPSSWDRWAKPLRMNAAHYRSDGW